MAVEEHITEYRFHIDAFSPETIPLERLAEYLGYIARIIGEKDSVHFSRLESGSTTPVLRVDREAVPKVRERIHLVRAGDGPAESHSALQELNKRLAQDNASGALIDPESERVLRFPGRDEAVHTEFGPFTEAGSFEGVPIKVGGERQNVPVHLEDGGQVHIISAPRRIAIEIAKHLFTSPVRVAGKGRWMRDRMGNWVMQKFLADEMEVLRREGLEHSILKLRTLQGQWKALDDPLRALAELRSGGAEA